MDRELICIVCPQGCTIKVSGTEDKLEIEGNRCQRGHDYAVKEVTAPERTITSSVKVSGGELPVASVKTDGTVPKANILNYMKEIRKARVKAPVNIGDVVIEDLGGTSVKVVVTKKVGKR
ncbi:MAG: DUF1667 domain-containing protein [Candidatus Altiarchaeales archaeon]|nr:DUF1667 domain-containing protein [Candidatus Altiarchaeales archaeon]MBD3416820.1 DUF1667 domain-containing protein [Candidatus Altiarchaeales archaeon]